MSAIGRTARPLPARRRRAALLATLGAALALTGALPAHAAADATWQFAPAIAPPPPQGAAPSPYPVALGHVGDIRFWSPNRGVLITGGTQTTPSAGVVPMGVYAYDGVGWHQLSTVCGGRNGRIAWAGPDEFWTIADQRPGQTGVIAMLANISLCHFLNGQVVGSYAMPLNQPDSYQAMNAAACRNASDCWFGGGLVPAPGRGAFHLHWDGGNVTEVTSPQDHAVTDIAAFQTQLFESVNLDPTDDFGSDDPAHPAVLHTIAPPGSSTIFRNVVPSDPTCAGQAICPPLPDYGSDASGKPVAPTSLTGLLLSSDWSPSGSFGGTPQLWAVAGPSRQKPPAGTGTPQPIALRFSSGTWTEVLPRLGTLPADQTPVGVAADPGAGAAWLTLSNSNDSIARVVRVTSSGAVSAPVQLGPDQGVGPRGAAGPIACPGPEDCWAATSDGWLFHLTDGTQLPQDSDPNFAGVITYRPPDGGIPFIPPDAPPPDTSLADQVPPVVPIDQGGTDTGSGGDSPGTTKRARTKKVPALVTHVSAPSIIHRTTLRMTFTLTAAARIQLIGRRGGKIVARSRLVTLRKGKHSIDMKLNVKRWPTKLAFNARPVTATKKKPATKKPATKKT